MGVVHAILFVQLLNFVQHFFLVEVEGQETHSDFISFIPMPYPQPLRNVEPNEAKEEHLLQCYDALLSVRGEREKGVTGHRSNPFL